MGNILNFISAVFEFLQTGISRTFYFVFHHKKLVFIYIPLFFTVLFSVYTFIIYLNWRSDRDAALNKLSRYKQLIDRTEEIRKGVSFTSSDIDLGAKVVDIPTRIYDRNGEIIGEFFEQKREIVPYSEIPEWVVKGVIASEDRDFYNHRGVNPMGILRAMITNIVNLRIAQGGSTITQQLAKVLFTDMDRSIKRKIYEIFCAREIEKRYDKQDILSMYLNLIYFGNGSYGVESTSKMFFGKSVSQCNEAESSMIVATISNPMIYSPISNLNNSVRKTKRIMKSLVDTKNITQARADYQYKQFLLKWDVKYNKKNEADSSLIGSFIYSSYRVNRAPFFNELIRQELVDRFGEDSVKRGGMSVYTTIDGVKQDAAVRALRDGISKQRQYHIDAAAKIRSPKKADEEKDKSTAIEGAIVSVHPQTGEILAYEGGYSFSVQNFYDHVSKSRRQPGSSFKPLLYASAFEEKEVTNSKIYVDERTVFSDKYSPQNYDGGFNGKVTVYNAIVKSMNIVAVKVLEETGYDTMFDYIRKGLDLSDSEMNDRFKKTLSIALGTYEISPLESVQLHSLLVNGGKFIKPYGIAQVKDYSGNVVWDAAENSKKLIDSKRDEYGIIMHPQAAAITLDALKGVLREGGTAYYAAKSAGINFPAAGKTGTSTDYNDAWFMGYTSDSVTAVWIGNKRGAISLGNGRTGGAVAAPVWANYASQAYRSTKPAEFILNEDGLVRQKMCIDSGMVPNEGLCPNTVEVLFYQGSEPGGYCPIHKQAESPVPGEKG